MPAKTKVSFWIDAARQDLHFDYITSLPVLVSISTSRSLALSIVIINILRSAMFNLLAFYLLNLDQNT